MPLTEINVTNPPPVFRNAWAERDAAAGGHAPAAALARGRSRPAGGGPSQAARLSPAGLPRANGGSG